MFDFGKLIRWVGDGLFEPVTTWEAYKAENHSWSSTATQFSIPLVVGTGVLTLILGWVFADSYLLGGSAGFTGFIGTLIMSLIWFGVGSWIASFLAAKFGGTNSFDQAWGALTFASIPGLVGSVLGTLPWIGGLLAFAGAIWSLVLLYQALAKFLDVPTERAVGHFFSTLGLSIVAMLVTGTILTTLGLGMSGSSDNGRLADLQREVRDLEALQDDRTSSRSSDASRPRSSSSDNNESDDSSDGAMFGFGRELDYLEEADNDRYTPPENGKLDEDQVELATRYLAAAQRLREDSQESLEKLGGEDNEEPSFGDLFKGFKGLVSAGTAEMQAVKSANGNWAEHQWVKKQLFEARLHQDLNDVTAHNYELYQRYEEQLKDWL